MILFSPGPSNISERVRRALLAPDIGHRDPEGVALLDEVRALVARVCGVSPDDGYVTVLLGGSGTLAIEAVVSALRPCGRVLVIANGPYGERAAAIGRHHAVAVEEWRLDWGAAIPLDALARRLDAAPTDAVYVVHHETATGRLNPLREIAAVAKARGALVVADTVSSVVGEPLDLAAWGVDGALGSSTKCIRGVPGVAFVIASPALMALARRAPSVHYASLALHADGAARGEPPFTPPLTALHAFREALRETLDETVPARQAHYALLMSVTQGWLDELGVARVIPRDATGRTLVACRLPAGWEFARWHAAHRADGWSLYAAQGPLKADCFRIGLVGHFGVAEVEGLFATMRRVLGA